MLKIFADAGIVIKHLDESRVVLFVLKLRREITHGKNYECSQIMKNVM